LQPFDANDVTTLGRCNVFFASGYEYDRQVIRPWGDP
jgi:hypothetical protein